MSKKCTVDDFELQHGMSTSQSSFLECYFLKDLFSMNYFDKMQ